ncbi:protein of unknown function [Streptantibioticus cattleyicolor NRRL 8057 = DSM 46488]|nr:protein of unknown function [Streptantibioticus cattleyicolor NRRL 8057 = DSM 46488]
MGPYRPVRRRTWVPRSCLRRSRVDCSRRWAAGLGVPDRQGSRWRAVKTISTAPPGPATTAGFPARAPARTATGTKTQVDGGALKIGNGRTGAPAGRVMSQPDAPLPGVQ